MKINNEKILVFKHLIYSVFQKEILFCDPSQKKCVVD